MFRIINSILTFDSTRSKFILGNAEYPWVIVEFLGVVFGSLILWHVKGKDHIFYFPPTLWNQKASFNCCCVQCPSEPGLASPRLFSWQSKESGYFHTENVTKMECYKVGKTVHSVEYSSMAWTPVKAIKISVSTFISESGTQCHFYSFLPSDCTLAKAKWSQSLWGPFL